MEASSRIAVRTATCLYSHNALSWQRLRAGKNELVLLCIDIICDHVDQLRSLNAIDDEWRAERLYTDGDLQLAAYAAALRVITSYETIDRQDVGADVFRKLAKGEKTVIKDLIEYAASVANNMLVPEEFSTSLWRDLDPSSRFDVRMLDMEHKGATKFADFENFAKTFALASYQDLMGATQGRQGLSRGCRAVKGVHVGRGRLWWYLPCPLRASISAFRVVSPGIVGSF
jgi:hypothetical protein